LRARISGLAAVALDQGAQALVHLAGLAAIADGQLLLRRREPMLPTIMVESALANLLLNMEPSQATTAWCACTVSNR
jgi:hypothetical protein